MLETAIQVHSRSSVVPIDAAYDFQLALSSNLTSLTVLEVSRQVFVLHNLT